MTEVVVIHLWGWIARVKDNMNVFVLRKWVILGCIATYATVKLLENQLQRDDLKDRSGDVLDFSYYNKSHEKTKTWS